MKGRVLAGGAQKSPQPWPERSALNPESVGGAQESVVGILLLPWPPLSLSKPFPTWGLLPLSSWGAIPLALGGSIPGWRTDGLEGRGFRGN